MIPVAIWNLLHSKVILRTKQGLLQLIFIGVSMLPYIMSLISYPEYINDGGKVTAVWWQNTLNIAIFFLFFMYLNLVKSMPERGEEIIYRLLRYYLFFNVFLAILYWIDYRLYFSVRSVWSLSGEALGVGDFSSITRFTGILSDPNNSSIMMVAVFSYLSLYRKTTVKELAAYFVACIICIVSAMSVTGVVSFILTIPIVVFSANGSQLTGQLNFGRKIFLSVILAALLALSYFAILATDVGSVAIERVTSGSVESRSAKFSYLLNSDTILKLLIGDGGTVIYGDEVFRPHIGHLHMMLNYGLIAYLIFVRIVFWVRSDVSLVYYWPIFVIFVGFSSNTGFLDFRFSMLAAILLAAYQSVEKLSKRSQRG